jgi:Fe-Mn family superoxide dismutase
MSGEGEIVIGMDVWEHSYYLKHKSQRAKYIDDFFKVLCWRSAEKRYQQIING